MNISFKTKVIIAEAYLALLSSDKKTTVQEICRDAFVSRRTFYNYFTNLEQLQEFTCKQLLLHGSTGSEDFPALISLLESKTPHIKALIEAGCSELLLRHLISAILSTVVCDVGVSTSASACQNPRMAASALAHLLLEYVRGDSCGSAGDIMSLYNFLFPQNWC